MSAEVTATDQQARSATASDIYTTDHKVISIYKPLTL